MNVPNNFAFFNVKKTLPQGEYEGKIVDFAFREMTAKSSGKPYVSLSAKVEIAEQIYFVNLSLDPSEKGKSTNSLILQLVEQTGKTEKELIEICSNPVDFFNIAKDKTIKLISTDKGYLDVWNESKLQNIDPKDIPF